MDYGTSPWPPRSTELPAEDLDEDGMSDAWETSFGLDTMTDDSAGDLDHAAEQAQKSARP